MGLVQQLHALGKRGARSLVHGYGVPVLMTATFSLVGLGSAYLNQPAHAAASQTVQTTQVTYWVDGWVGEGHHHEHDGDMDGSGFSDPYGTYPAKPYVDGNGQNMYMTVPSQYAYGDSAAGGYVYVYGSSSTDGSGAAPSNNAPLSGTSYIDGYSSDNGYGNPNGLGQ